MKIKFNNFIYYLFLFIVPPVFAQSEALTSSPYSLYGLGIINQASIGKTNGLGFSGIGMKTPTNINNLNPANFALIPRNTFLYDVGVKAQINQYSNNLDSEKRTNFNFSNLAFAFPVGDSFGAGVSLIPFSEVGYSIVGVNTNVEGSTESFESNINGFGGLSDLKLNIGYQLSDYLRIGFGGSFLFGNIKETENLYVNRNYFESQEETNYFGFRLGSGLQLDLTKTLTFGASVQLPTSLGGNMKESGTKTLDGISITVADDKTSAVSDYKLPLEMGLGLGAKLFNSWKLMADYKRNFWTQTDQQEALGTYENQNIYAIGLEYQRDATSYNYNDRIQYRIGFNYNDGYLSLNESKIDGYNITAGIGIPMRSGTKSFLNLSYGYGTKGKIQNFLIKENFHLLTLNLSLEDTWFVKRKIN